MRVTIELPATLRAYCGRAERRLVVEAETLAGALDALRREYPDVYRGVCDDAGAVRRHVNLFVDSNLVRGDLDRSLGPGNVVYIMPAVSGG